MSEILKKPYEISVWEDQLVRENDTSYFKETKIAVIGSNTMTAPNRVYSPILTETNNGENTLTFSLKYRYYDEMVGDFVVNQFVTYLVNERRIKLKYRDKWYEFIIKNRDESSEEYTYTYTATDAFVNELSKNGYNITFSTDLNNNQGTAVELAKETLKSTDWIVDEENSDTLKQLVDEPIYRAAALQQLTCIDLDTNEPVIIESGTQIYIFYSYIQNKKGGNFQFIKRTQNDSYITDDNNVIIATNYRFVDDFEVVNDTIKIKVIENEEVSIRDIISIGDLDTNYKAYRLVYSPKTTYDPVSEHTVDIYEIEYNNEKQEVYHYVNSDYTTSSLITNFVTNGGNFTDFTSNNITGWSNTNSTSNNKLLEYELVTVPPIDGSEPLVDADGIITSYLKIEGKRLNLNTNEDRYRNTLFNSGITDHISEINHISQGEKYLFRVKYKVEDAETGDLVNASNNVLRGIIAKYSLGAEKTIDGETYQLRTIAKDDVIFRFNSEGDWRSVRGLQAQTIVSGGDFQENDYRHYLINGVIQTPSTSYVYKTSDNQYYTWDAINRTYVQYDENTWNGYKCCVAEALKSVSTKSLKKNGDRYGIFIYPFENTPIYLEDIQITKYVEDADGKPIFLGSAPSAKVLETDNFYLKPNEELTKDDINTYSSLQSLADGLSVDVDSIKQVYNENHQKVLSINEEKSNCFNILQTICETFECWLDIEVEHDDEGYIKQDENGKLIKKVALKEYSGKDNFAGFRYGINLSSIQRTINSDEIVTKLIVGQPSNEYVPEGTLSITSAAANPSGESYIYNFDYYLNQGLIADREGFNRDLYKFYEDIKAINDELKLKNAEAIQLSLALIKSQDLRDVYLEAYEAAQDSYNSAASDFKEITNISYEKFLQRSDRQELLENESIREAAYTVEAYKKQLDQYSQVLPNIQKEYDELNLKYNGAQTYTITVMTRGDDSNELDEDFTKLVISDYIEGIKFTFKNDTNRLQFESTVYKKEFKTDEIYPSLIFTEIPTDYHIEYTFDNETYQLTDLKTTFTIYDTTNHVGMVKKIKLVPDESLTNVVGLKQLIENKLKEKEELEKEFYSKYGRFIQEGTWESNDYINPDLYYIDALQVSKTSAQPQIEYSINVLELSQLEGFENYDFEVGDKTYIEDIEFFGYQLDGLTPVKEEVIVSEVEWHLDEPDTNIITIQNYKTRFEDLFQRITATVQSVQYNAASYARVSSILDETGSINQGVFLSSLNGVAGQSYDMTAGGAIRMTSEGIIVKNLTYPENCIIIRSSGIERSNDGGRTWSNLVSPLGINTEALTAGKINTNNIVIGNDTSPSFRWDKAGLSAYGSNEDGSYDLKTFVRFDEYGLYGIQNNSEYVASSLDDIKENANFGLTWDGFFIKNRYRDGYVSISSTDDIQVVANDSERIKIGYFEDTDDYGIRIKNSDGQTVFETDDNGDITVTGTINATAGSFSGRVSAAEGLIGGFTIGQNALYKGVFGESDSIYLSTGYASDKPIAEFVPANPVWAIGVSDNFGVTTGGALYATGAHISGAIYADTGVFTGYVNAQGGVFTDKIIVGPSKDKYIIIDTTKKESIIASSDYENNTTRGWMIDGKGNAVFDNVSVRGSIKTAVFEYSEIEAVGGAFLFRPSTSIKTAEIQGNDIVLTTEKHLIFSQNEWVKVSNINDESRVDDNLSDGGLTHVYRIKNNPKNDEFIVLDGAAADFTSVIPFEDINVVDSSYGTEETIKTDPEDDTDIYVFEEDGNLYSIDIDTDLQMGYEYYFNFDNKLYYERPLRHSWTQVIYDVESDPIETEVDREVIYIGNISLLDRDAKNSTGSFLIATENGETKVYVEKEGVYRFEVLLAQEIDFKTNIKELEGGSLISFGFYDIAYTPFNVGETGSPVQFHLYELVNEEYVLTEDDEAIEGKTYYKEQYEEGRNNYGIGINSSDNYVNLPERAISLFETTIHPNNSVKVSYDYKGILGTLPPLEQNLVDSNIYPNYMEGTQGIFTNNMYIGDSNQYVAFYEDEQGNKQLKIKAKQIMFEISDPEPGQDPWQDIADIEVEGVPGPAGEDAIYVIVDSTAGNFFKQGVVSTSLIAHVYQGSTEITNQFNTFRWYRRLPNGTEDLSWHTSETSNRLDLTTADVDDRAVFVCEVVIGQ